MKSLFKFIVIIVSICMLEALFVSCDKMNDIHKKYLDEGERPYVGMPDSLTAFAGKGRVKLTWIANADPQLETTVIYWNMREDSIVKPFIRIKEGMQKDSVIIDGLSEDTHLFEIINKNSRNEHSMTATVQGRSYGDNYELRLFNRLVKRCMFDDNGSSLIIEWHDAGSTEVGVKLVFTDVDGNSRTMEIPSTETVTTIPDFKLGEPVYCSTMHEPEPMMVDRLYAPAIAIPYTVNITKRMTNTEYPFRMGDFVNANNWELVEWIVNEEAAINGCIDNYEGRALLSYVAWDDYPQSVMNNGKIYQTIELEAGSYRFDATHTGVWHYDWAAVYLTVALGTTLPDVENISTALGSFPVTASGNTETLSVNFNVPQKSLVSLGFVMSGHNIQSLWNKVELWQFLDF